MGFVFPYIVAIFVHRYQAVGVDVWPAELAIIACNGELPKVVD